LILQDLCALYERLAADAQSSGIALRGYSPAPVSHALELSDDGRIVAVIPLAKLEKKKLINPKWMLPERLVRTAGVRANYLSDNSGYALGRDSKGKPGRSAQLFQAFRELNLRILSALDDPGARAFCAFLNRWNPTQFDEPLFDDEREALLAGGNLVFMFNGTYLHERPALRAAWEREQSDEDTALVGQCLITGEELPIASVHPSIKGVVGAQSTGAALVSFNSPAFKFFNKSQSLNAPVSERAAFAYTTALNHLLNLPKGSGGRCIRIGDISQVFWARTHAPLEEGFTWCMVEPIEPQEDAADGDRDDAGTAKMMWDALLRLRAGRPLAEMNLNENVHMHLLGLAPNAARISVRYYYVDSFGALVQRVVQHHRDTEIVHGPSEPEFLAPWMIMRETAAQGKADNVPQTLSGALMRAIYTGQSYPSSLYAAVMMRIRSDKTINRVRAAVIKAYLLRDSRLKDNKEWKEGIKVGLNEEWNAPAYLMGRLFALMEKAQSDAIGSVGASIRDRYFASASATPGTVFPVLLRMAQHHITKINGHYLDMRIQEVVGKIGVGEENPKAFPNKLDLSDQGLFMVGYYHQRQALYTKRVEEAVEA
jgi:CRISPR-associated protein Csd1